jgi:O-antigen/teichoic acid export membrane protein
MNLQKMAGFALGPIGVAAVSLLTVPITAWYFSAEDIGKISILQIAISFSLLLFSLGLDQAYVREYHEAKNKKELFKACFWPGSKLLIACLAFLLLLQGKISEWLFGIESLQNSLAVAVCIFFAFVGRFISLILRMHERAWAYSTSQLLPKIVYLLVIGVIIVGNSQKGLAQLLTAHAISFLSVALSFAWYTREDWNSSNVTVTKKDQKNLLKFGLPLVVNGIAFWGMISMDRLFLKHYSTYEQLGIYSVTNSFAGVAAIVQSIFSTIWAPTAYRWHSEGVDSAAFQKIAHKVLLVVIFVFSIVGMFSWVLPYFLPPQYKNSQFIIMSCLMYPLFYTLSEITGIGIGIARKSKWQMLIMLCAFCFNLILNMALVPKYGALGAALSTGLSFYLLFILRTEMSKKIGTGVGGFRIYIVTGFSVLLVILSSIEAYQSIYLRVIWLVLFLYSIYRFIVNAENN